MKMRYRWLASMLVAAVVLSAQLGFTQTTVKNPTGFQFTCPDHGADDAHEMQIVRASDNVVIQTLALGDPIESAGIVTGTLNVQPVAFGRYYSRVRAISGSLASDWSDPSNVWERAPGKPGGVLITGN